MSQEVQIKSDIGEQVIARVNSLCESGFVMPAGYSYVNAIKMSFLKLNELKDKTGKPALEVCTASSVQIALFKMVTQGLNAALSQCYFIVRGNQLCCDPSYFGMVKMVKRVYPDWNPCPVVIREDDVFQYGINPETGKRYIIKHEQKLENIDKGFVGAYIVLPTGDLYIMTKKQILTAWSKSSSREQTVHKQFEEKMIGKTIINSGCKMIVNSTPEFNVPSYEDEDDLENPVNEKKIEHGFTDFEEVHEDSETEIKIQSTAQTKIKGQSNSDDITDEPEF